MNVINFSELKQPGAADSLKEILPAIVQYNGEPLFVIANPDDVVVLTDLHPRVRRSFKAMEAKVRIGMPKPQKPLIVRS